MTIEEVFSLTGQRMVEGLMVHSQMSDYYNFLSLKGYAECHKYHYFCESANYKNLCGYYICHCNKLITDRPFNNPKIIPDNWFMFTRQDVDESIRKAAIETGFERWAQWERDSKKLYEQRYQNLIALGEVAAAMEIKKYVIDVDNELADAEKKHLALKAENFDISNIIAEQDELYKKYCKKIKELDLND